MDIKTQMKIKRKLIKRHTKLASGCWEYSGSTKKGYGRLYYTYLGKAHHGTAHRLSFILFRNRLELLERRDLMVCHKCDNKACINPEHLYVGTWVENNMDSALRCPDVSKEFMERAIRLFAKKHGIRYTKNIKNIEKYYK